MTSIRQILQDEIRDAGAISFERFMEVALYCPEFGYYQRPDTAIGQRGDFFTSVSVGPIFGELLAFQFACWLEALDCREVQLVEAGAHDGSLCRDILGWIRHWRSSLYERIEYWIVEPFVARQERQKVKLSEFGAKVRWSNAISDLPERGISGVIFSNELLDALPVRRFGWDAGGRRWFEWGVGTEAGEFVWYRMESKGAAELVAAPAARGLEDALPDAYTIESSPAAGRWWSEATSKLQAGKLLAIDYGFSTTELLAPERKDGTLRGYYRHHQVSNVLANPGEQDLTAHVNFTALQQAGEAAGLRTEQCTFQEQFLTSIFQKTCNTESNFGEWTPARARQFQTLVHPEHLGRRFRVLVQGKTLI